VARLIHDPLTELKNTGMMLKVIERGRYNLLVCHENLPGVPTDTPREAQLKLLDTFQADAIKLRRALFRDLAIGFFCLALLLIAGVVNGVFAFVALRENSLFWIPNTAICVWLLNMVRKELIR